MGRSAAARPLTRRYDVAVATAGDDPEIRRLLRESAFGGSVRLSLEREPDSLAPAVEGDVHSTIVARDSATGVLAGIASRSVRDAFLNGQPARLGYLGQLRIAPGYRSRRELLHSGFEFCRSLHQRQRDTRLYLASVVAENHQAMRLLSLRPPGWPRFQPVDRLVSLAIPAARRTQRCPAGVTIERASDDSVVEIVRCLLRHGPASQFYPRWSTEHFGTSRLPGLRPDDFVIARVGGRVVGCVACWDQRTFKQVVVRGYSPSLARWRPVLNVLSPVTGVPRLPRPGTPLRSAYLSHFALDPDLGKEVLPALVGAACTRAAEKGLDYAVLGLSARCRSLAVLQRAFKHRRYESVLYVAFWPDGEALAASLDERPSYPELALL